jgi:hypothetical protein
MGQPPHRRHPSPLRRGLCQRPEPVPAVAPSLRQPLPHKRNPRSNIKNPYISAPIFHRSGRASACWRLHAPCVTLLPHTSWRKARTCETHRICSGTRAAKRRKYTPILPKKVGERKKARQMIWKYERHAYFCPSKNPAMNNLCSPQNKFQAQLATTCSMASCAFLGMDGVACIQRIWVGCTQVAG